MEASTRTELEANIAARRELGPEHDDALIESCLERIERGLQQDRPDPNTAWWRSRSSGSGSCS